MSSWKNASKSSRKLHRERHQPQARCHLGLLEKKKDYQKRARDSERKTKTLQLLHRRTLNKNPDEFYYHMVRSKLHDGVHHDERKKDEHTPEQLALMSTQDIKYITMKRTIENRRIKRLQSQLHMIDFANTIPNKHVFFIDNDIDKLKQFDLAKHLETHPDLLPRRTNRPRLQDLEKIQLPNLDPTEIKKANALKERAYRELANRIKREKELAVVQDKIEIRKALQQTRLLKPQCKQRGTKDKAPIYIFPYERKK